MDIRDLYRGYVFTNGKIPTHCKLKDPRTYVSLAQINASNAKSYAGVLGDNTVLIDFDDMEDAKIALALVQDKQVDCRVLQTTRGMHFLFENNGVFEKAHTNKRLALGLHADIKIGSKDCVQCLRLDGVDRDIIYDTGVIGATPEAFYPVNSKQDPTFVGAVEGSRNDMLYRYIPVLHKVMNKDAVKSVIKDINKYVFADSLDDAEIATITRDEAFTPPAPQAVSTTANGTPCPGGGVLNPDGDAEEALMCMDFFEKGFYKGRFRHDAFARFFLEHEHVIKLGQNEWKRMAIYKDGIYVVSDDEIQARMCNYLPGLTFAQRSEVMRYIRSVILQGDTKDMQPELSRFANFIAFRNGLWDIMNEKLIPFDPDIIVMNKIDWDFNEDAYSDIIDNMLDKLTNGDDEIRSILEEMIGYTFYRRNEMGKSFIIVGPQSNGKSTFQAMLERLLGENNVSNIDMKDFGTRFSNAEIAEKLANIGDDIGDGFIDDNSGFKTVVSGGRYQAERKGKDPFKIRPYAKCIFSANNIPKTKDRTGAIKRRLVIIPFEHVFSPKDDDYDPYFIYKVENGYSGCSADDNMSYLINIGLAGLNRVLVNGCFTHSDKVDKKLEEYDESNNPIKIFYREYAENVGGSTFGEAVNMRPVSFNELYEQYVSFCDDGYNKPMSKPEFRKTVKADWGVDTKTARVDGVVSRICFTNKKG